MISRTEMVWRHLLVAALDLGIRRSSLTQLGAELNLPVSTIHKALERPRAIGAVRGSASGLRVLDPRRLQLLWAAQRDLKRDIVYATRVALTVSEIEARLQVSVIPTCQVYADLFNLPTWQAQRFLEALDRELLRDVA